MKKILQYHIVDNDLRLIDRALNKPPIKNLHWQPELPPFEVTEMEFMRAISGMGLMQTSLAETLGQFSYQETSYSAIHLTGLPHATQPESLSMLIATLLGRVQEIKEEAPYIRRISEVQGAPRDHFYATRSGTGHHTDLSYAPNRPEFLVIHSVTNPENHGGLSCIADLRHALEYLRENQKNAADIINQLLYTGVTFNAPDHWRGEKQIKGTILELTGRDDPHIRFRLDTIEMPDTLREAFDKLHKALQQVETRFLLKENEVLLIDNHRATHARTNFEPVPDQPRTMLRTYVNRTPFLV